MLGQSDQLGNYVNVIKQLLNKAITDILSGILRTQELPSEQLMFLEKKYNLVFKRFQTSRGAIAL